MSRAARQAQAQQAQQAQQAKAALDRTLDWETRARSGAVRTAWIVGGLALAFFIAALVEGHRGKLYPSWEPNQAPPAVTTPARAAAPAFAPAPSQAHADRTVGAVHNTPSSRP